MKITIEITSETRNDELSKIVKALDAMIHKPNEDNKQDQKVEEKPTRKKSEKPAIEVNNAEGVSTESKSATDISTEERANDTEATDTKVETSNETNESEKKVTFEEVKKLALEVRQKGVSIADIRGAMERGSEGKASKTLELEPLTEYYSSVYAELEKLA